MKNTSNEEFDRLLRNKMRGMEMPPPAFEPVNRRPYSLYFKYAAAAVALLFIFSYGGYHLWQKTEKGAEAVAQEKSDPKNEVSQKSAPSQKATPSSREKPYTEQASVQESGKTRATSSQSRIPSSTNPTPRAQNKGVSEATQSVSQPLAAVSEKTGAKKHLNESSDRAEKVGGAGELGEKGATSDGSSRIPAHLSGIPIPPQIAGSGVFFEENLPNSASMSTLSQDENAMLDKKGRVKGAFPVKIAFIGAQSLHGLSWVINQNTYGLYDRKLANSSSGIINRFGTQLGLEIYDDTYLVLGANYLAKQQHSYLLNIQGKEIEQRLTLTYHQLPVMIQQKHKAVFSSKPQWRAYWETGFQYARLLSARLKFGGDDASTYRRFKEHELSVLAGYSVEYQFAPKWSFKTGIRARIGSGINAEEWLVRGETHSQSHNANISATLALRYWFNKP
mgnify:CR=1 FL=1